MNPKDLETFAREVAKHLKTEKDLSDFTQMLTKVAVEAALNGELDAHLGYEKHQKSTSANSRNGHATKTLKTEEGSSSSIPHATAMAASNPSWLRNTKPASPPWMTRF